MSNSKPVATSAGRWSVVDWTAAASELHGLPLPDPVEPSVWCLNATAAALVLGSSQRGDIVDAEAASRLGIAITSRRSGGGAVLVVPGHVVWLDVLIPSGDPLWVDDVGHAFHWLGQVWVEALGELGVQSEMHRGPFERSAASDLVCFAGRGPGEVFVEGAKVVGISQRRTRAGARFQCAATLVWDPEPLTEVLSLSPAIAADVAAAGRAIDVSADAVLRAFLGALTTR